MKKKVAIWGLGKEGWSILQAIKRKFPEKHFVILDDNSPSEATWCKLQQDDKISFYVKDELLEQLFLCDVVIKSPGISSYRHEIIAAKEKGAFFTTAANIWFAEHNKEKTICVTGTKGKSTTTVLIYNILKELGYSVAMAGNIGVPFFDITHKDITPDFWVVELSSYQLCDFSHSPSIAVLLNLFQEHLNWHGNADTYYKDKLNLLRNIFDKHAVINSKIKNPFLTEIIENINILTFNDKKNIHHSKGTIYDGNVEIINQNSLHLQGEHNLSNICAALTVARSLNINIKKCIPPLKKTNNLPHRLNIIGKLDGITYIDDSISTIPESAIAAVKSFPGRSITILLGGFDRGIEYDNLIKFLLNNTSINGIVTMPTNGYKIARLFREKASKHDSNSIEKLHEAKNMANAVEIAKKNTPTGGVILLSPAASSYDFFDGFEDRGLNFSNAVFGE